MLLGHEKQDLNFFYFTHFSKWIFRCLQLTGQYAFMVLTKEIRYQT